MALLDVKGLHASYGATRVLHGLDFSLDEGSITTLLGANGAGKTTTLRALCAMVKTAGDIRFGGEPIGARATEDIVRMGIAHVPDGRGTFANLTTEENLRLGAYTRKDRPASRSATDGNVRSAIAQVRNALEAVTPKAVGRSVGGSQVVDPARLASAQKAADAASGESMAAFDAARRYARGRRNWQESSPAIAAALDDVAPDRFVKDYILSNSNKAATAEVEKALFTLRRDPQAMQAVKENIVGYFKSKALGGAADEVGSFSPSAYNKALNEFGDLKLRLFFSKDEIAQLKALGRVASYENVQPKGSAVNNSNTAGTFAGILDRIASSALVGKLPLGDAAIGTPARNWSAQIGIRDAMDPYAGISRQVPREPARTVSELLFGPALLLSAPHVEGGN